MIIKNNNKKKWEKKMRMNNKINKLKIFKF